MITLLSREYLISHRSTVWYMLRVTWCVFLICATTSEEPAVFTARLLMSFYSFSYTCDDDQQVARQPTHPYLHDLRYRTIQKNMPSWLRSSHNVELKLCRSLGT